jgi:hypothetical protein
MKTIHSILLMMAAITGLTGCNEVNSGRPTKTVAWFFEHRDELQLVLTACRDNPGELAQTPDCINANEARNKVTVQEMEDALK